MSSDFTPLKSDEIQLYELVRLSNVVIDERVFKIILELLKLNIKPEAILNVLQVLATKQGQTTARTS
jgi:mitotic-spindle organizing protein 2A/2B